MLWCHSCHLHTPARAQPAAVQRNLVIRFKDDSIDGSIELAQLLQSSSAIQTTLDLSLRTLDGDHVRPLGQVRPRAWECVCTHP